MPTTKDALSGDPGVSAYFSLELEGKATGYFTEVSGLGSENEVIEHKIMGSDGNTEAVRKVPGRLKWQDITLKRGITTNLDIWDWRQEVVNGNVTTARINGSIVMYSQEGDPIARWDFEKGWPSKVSGPTPKSDSNEIAMEELVVAHEGIERVM